MSDLRSSLNRLWLIFVAFYSLFFVIAIGLFFLVGYNHHKNLADAFSIASRNSIAIRDLRQAVLILNSAIGKSFDAIEFDSDSRSVFVLPSETELSEVRHRIWTVCNKVELVQNPDIPNSQRLGELHFCYNAASQLSLGLLIWAILTLTAFPLFRRARNIVESRHRLLADLSAANAVRDIAQQVAHDIRSPISALNIFSKIVSNGKEAEKELLEQAISRISKIADDLLKKDQITSARPVPVMKIVRGIFNEKFGEKSDLIELSLRPIDDEVTALAEESSLGRILSNLLNNGIEAIPKGGKVDLVVTAEEQIVSLSIEDNGIGILKENLKKVGAAGFTTKTKGNGLGLSNAMKLVKEWGGHLEVKSEWGVGTKVVVKLRRVN